MNEIEIFQPVFEAFGGEERVHLALARRLIQLGKPVSLLCYEDRIDMASHADFPITVRTVDMAGTGGRRHRALARHLADAARAGAPTPMLCNIQSAAHAGFSVRTRYHLRIPDTFSLLGRTSLKTRLLRPLMHLAVRNGIRQASSFTTNTNALADEMRALYGRRPDVLRLGGVAPEQAVAPKASDGVIRILSVSRLTDSKRIDWIFDALHTRRDGDVVLDVVGSGPERERLEAQAAANGLADRVRFHGFVSDAALDALFRACHIFAMPARQGYGIPAIEAVNYRQAVVLTDESGVHEILHDTPWAIVTAAGKSAFAKGVEEAVRRVRTEHLLESDPAELPTERQWADALIATTDWLAAT